jgi:hypothetical protein
MAKKLFNLTVEMRCGHMDVIQSKTRKHPNPHHMVKA